MIGWILGCIIACLTNVFVFHAKPATAALIMIVAMMSGIVLWKAFKP